MLSPVYIFALLQFSAHRAAAMPIIQPTRDLDGDVMMSNSIGSIEPLSTPFDFDHNPIDDRDGDSGRSPRTPTFAFASQSQSSCVQSFPSSSFFTFSRVSSQQPLSSRTQPRRPVTLPPPPSEPLGWVWKCHLCHTKYPLGVTRRCLIDGHYYCSGNVGTSQKNVKKKKKAQSCSSEFDYVGWEEWSKWRRKTLGLKTLANTKAAGSGPLITTPAAIGLHGCENCEFPSQCRYEKQKTTADIVLELIPVSEFTQGNKADSSSDHRFYSNYNTSPATPHIQTQEAASAAAVLPPNSIPRPTYLKSDTNLDSISLIPPLPELKFSDAELDSIEATLQQALGNAKRDLQKAPDSGKDHHDPPSATTKANDTGKAVEMHKLKQTSFKKRDTQSLLTDFFKGAKKQVSRPGLATGDGARRVQRQQKDTVDSNVLHSDSPVMSQAAESDRAAVSNAVSTDTSASCSRQNTLTTPTLSSALSIPSLPINLGLNSSDFEEITLASPTENQGGGDGPIRSLDFVGMAAKRGRRR